MCVCVHVCMCVVTHMCDGEHAHVWRYLRLKSVLPYLLRQALSSNSELTDTDSLGSQLALGLYFPRLDLQAGCNTYPAFLWVLDIRTPVPKLVYKHFNL